MLVLGKKAMNMEDGKRMASEVISNGKAFSMLKRLVAAQGGDIRVIDDLSLLPQAKFTIEVKAQQDGWIKEVHAREVGESAVDLGAGRAKKGDPIDPAVGILVHIKVGDQVKAGQVLFEIKANDLKLAYNVTPRLLAAVKIVNEPVQRLPLFWGTIGG
jgi:pyrimidine-nucleoside phosphorylase